MKRKATTAKTSGPCVDIGQISSSAVTSILDSSAGQYKLWAIIQYCDLLSFPLLPCPTRFT